MEVKFVAPSDYECIAECFNELPEGVSYCITRGCVILLTEGLLIIIPLSLQSYQAGSGG